VKLPSVGVCAIFKDEALYLREWMLFHWLQGVERFYLYDNGSTDDWRAQIPELADSVIPWPGPVVQMAAYDDCLNRKPDVDWLAFIDIDEYLWDSTTRTLNEALMPVRASAVHVPWLMFGDGGHAQRSKRLTIDTYLRRAADYETLGKMIVRPGRARGCKTPHDFYIRGKVKTVDTLRFATTGRARRPRSASSSTGVRRRGTPPGRSASIWRSATACSRWSTARSARRSARSCGRRRVQLADGTEVLLDPDDEEFFGHWRWHRWHRGGGVRVWIRRAITGQGRRVYEFSWLHREIGASYGPPAPLRTSIVHHDQRRQVRQPAGKPPNCCRSEHCEPSFASRPAGRRSRRRA
jgi:hypothetical protein